ncbi:MAG TPA: hypothetical protein VEY93_13475 [Longimicrobium sp.]|nr:hypothetical protein [Longimicrobium sp.]
MRNGRRAGLVWSVLGLAAASLLACENSPTPVQQPGEQGSVQRPSFSSGAPIVAGQSIGDLLNEAMEAVFHALSRANRSGKLTPRAGCQVARTALMQFFREKGVLQGGAHQRQIDDGLLNAGCASAQRRGGAKPGDMVLTSYEYGSPYDAIANSGLSESARAYLYQIHDAVAYGASAPDIQNQVWAIEQQSAAVLSAEEAEIVAATASVAVSSIQYWDANFESWYYASGGGGDGGGEDHEVIGMQTAPGGIGIMGGGGFWGSARRVAAGDVGGAVAGAVTGAFAGGIGAGPGALAGAAGGSAGVATLELLERIF